MQIYCIFTIEKIRSMETKILLKLISEDISHLQGIAGEFNMESLPSADEVELALVRANALLRQLEVLHKRIIKTEDHGKIIESSAGDKKVVVESSDSVQEHVALIVETADTIHQVTPADTHEPLVDIQQKPFVSQESDKTGIAIISDSITTKEQITSDKSDQESKNQGESNQLVNDLFSQEKSESGYQIIPIKSIWDGIGINDRILFVRELFGNDSPRFEFAVNALNQLTTIQEAVSYLKINFKWRKTEASQKFLILVKRRFTK